MPQPGEDNAILRPSGGPVKMSTINFRKEGLTFEEFDYHWRVRHSALVDTVRHHLGYIRYVQTPAYKNDDIEVMKKHRGWMGTADGLTEVWWKSYEDMQRCLNSKEAKEAGEILKEDEERFVDATKMIAFLSEERVIFEA